MPEQGKGLYRYIALVLDSASTRKAQREMQEALARAGEVGGSNFAKELKKQFDRAVAEARVKWKTGLIDQKQFEREAKAAAVTFNGTLGAALQKLRADGKLTDDSFVSLSRRLKKTGEDGALSFGSLERTLTRVVAFFATGYLVRKVYEFGKSTVKAAAGPGRSPRSRRRGIIRRRRETALGLVHEEPRIRSLLRWDCDSARG